MNSGDANIPHALSLIHFRRHRCYCDVLNQRVYVDPKLALLNEKSVGVTSVLFTSTVTLSSLPVRGPCSANRPDCPPKCGSQAYHRATETTECALWKWKKRDVRPQRLRMRHDPWKMKMTSFLKKTQNNACWSPFSSSSHTRENVCVCEMRAVRCCVHISLRTCSYVISRCCSNSLDMRASSAAFLMSSSRAAVVPLDVLLSYR